MSKGKILFLFLIVLALLAAACSSSPPPAQPAQPAREPAQAPPPPPPPAPAPAPAPAAEPTYNRHSSGIILDGASRHRVVSGESLSQIAMQVYRDDSYYPLIQMVSGEVRDPDVLSIGMNLTVPVLNTNLNDTRARESMNRFFADAARLEEQRGRPDMAGRIRRHLR